MTVVYTFVISTKFGEQPKQTYKVNMTIIRN